MRYLIAGTAILATGFGAAVIAFFIGRGKLIRELRTYCDQFTVDDFDPIDTFGDDRPSSYSPRLWAEFDSVDKPFDHRGQL